jgi:DNA-binding response OmpR family regulator
MRILIVEDSDSILKMIEALVSARGFEVAGAKSGARAVEDAMVNTPEIVVVDFGLPGPVNATELMKRLRAESETKQIPIIVIGDAGDEAIRQNALESGATTYYTKPFSPISLLKEIDAIKAKLRSSGTEKVQQ